MKKALVAGTTVIRYTFTNLPDYDFDYSKAAEPMRDYAEVHGWSARLTDTAAGAKTEAERREAVVSLGTYYTDGAVAWNVKTSAKAAPINPAFVKIAALRQCSYEEAQAWYNEKLIAEMQAMVDQGA